MSNLLSDYIKLPGHPRRMFSLISQRIDLYLGEDHLLLVSLSSFTERCQRFDLKDIRAITVCSTSRYRTLNTVSGLLFLCFLSGALLAVLDENAALGGIAGGIATVFLIVFLYNLALGPTCIARLHTAVSKEVLQSLRRQRKARKAVAILRAAITNVQGILSDESLHGNE